MTDAMAVAATGMAHFAARMSGHANNIANSGTVRRSDEEPFHASVVESVEISGGGVRSVARPTAGEGTLAYNPESSLADDQGMVRGPDVDLATELTGSLIARRGFQMQTVAFERAAAMYKDVIALGDG